MDNNELCDMLSTDLDFEARFYITVPYNSDDSDFEWHNRLQPFQSDDSESEISTERAAKDINIAVEDSSTDTKIFKVNKHENVEKPHKAHKLKKKREYKKKTELYRKVESPKFKECSNVAPKSVTLGNNETFNTSCFKTPETNERNSSDSDEESLQALRKHRKLVSCKDNTSSTSIKKEAELYSTYPVNICSNNWETEWGNIARSSNISKTYPPSESSPDCSTNRFRNHKRSSRWSSNGSSTDSSSITSTNSSITILPCYKNYQLLGDSQLLRFSEQLLNARRYITYTENGSRRIGYCVSGQKIEDLRQRLSRKECPLSDKVIMLIGTNDFVYGTKLERMYESFEAIIKILTESSVSKILLITVPPVPKINHKPGYLSKLKEFNRFIRRHNEEGRIVAIDLGSLFLDMNYKIGLQYFEKTFANSNRTDLVHLNREGFNLLRKVLNNNYFDEISFNNR